MNSPSMLLLSSHPDRRRTESSQEMEILEAIGVMKQGAKTGSHGYKLLVIILQLGDVGDVELLHSSTFTMRTGDLPGIKIHDVIHPFFVSPGEHVLLVLGRVPPKKKTST